MITWKERNFYNEYDMLIPNVDTYIFSKVTILGENSVLFFQFFYLVFYQFLSTMMWEIVFLMNKSLSSFE
jgi:hypothetical protein